MAEGKKSFTLHCINARGEDKYIKFKSKKKARKFVDFLQHQLQITSDLV